MSEFPLPAALGGSPVRPAGPPDWPGHCPDVIAHLLPVLKSGAWGKYHGPHCGTLIELLQQRFACPDVTLCSSGTAAVELALRGCRLQAGDEVLLAGYDFLANFRNVLLVGATPVLVDIRADDGQLDVDLAARAITPRTKAVIASHLHGGCVDMPRLMELAHAHGITVIEDACQSVGATLHGRPLGAWGDVAVLSFGGSKLLSAGRGGAVLSYRAEIAQRIKLYQQRGNDAYPLSELQAAVLEPQLARLDELHHRRGAWIEALRSQLTGDEGLRLLAIAAPQSSPAYYKVGFWYDAAAFHGLSRDQFAGAMQAEGFAVYAGFRALHRCHARGRFHAPGPLTQAERADETLLLLHHPLLLEGLETVEQFLTAVRKLRQHAVALKDVPASANLNATDEH